MKAQRLTSHGTIHSNPLTLMEIDRPQTGTTDLLLRIKTCAICHTDLHVIEGELPERRLPLTPGHQIIGSIEETGVGAGEHKLGERVGVAWINSTCGVCEFCQRGDENLCPAAKFTGYDVDGGYAEYAVVPSGFAYPIPKRFSDEAAAPLLCAGIIGYRALRLSNFKPGSRLGLYGFGASAHIVIQLARHAGGEVYVFSTNEHHRQLARPEDLEAQPVGAR